MVYIKFNIHPSHSTNSIKINKFYVVLYVKPALFFVLITCCLEATLMKNCTELKTPMYFIGCLINQSLLYTLMDNNHFLGYNSVYGMLMPMENRDKLFKLIKCFPLLQVPQKCMSFPLESFHSSVIHNWLSQ